MLYLETTLEGLIDQHTLQAVLEAVEQVCHGKAEHLRANWQDEASARHWDRAAKEIGRASGNIDV